MRRKKVVPPGQLLLGFRRVSRSEAAAPQFDAAAEDHKKRSRVEKAAAKRHLLLLLRIAVSVAECLSGEGFLARTAPGHGCGAMLLEVANKPTSKMWHRETPLQ